MNPRLLRCERRAVPFAHLHKRASTQIKLAFDRPLTTATTVHYRPYWHDSGTTDFGDKVVRAAFTRLSASTAGAAHETRGRRSAHGRADSIWVLRASNVASSYGRPTS